MTEYSHCSNGVMDIDIGKPKDFCQVVAFLEFLARVIQDLTQLSTV